MPMKIPASLRSLITPERITESSRPNAPSRFSLTGTKDMAELILPGRLFKLIYVRLHFRLIENLDGQVVVFNNLTIDLDSSAGDQYDVRLFTYEQRGYGRDAHLLFTDRETTDPSPWTFEADDGLLFSWANPGLITWGLQVGVSAL